MGNAVKSRILMYNDGDPNKPRVVFCSPNGIAAMNIDILLFTLA